VSISAHKSEILCINPTVAHRFEFGLYRMDYAFARARLERAGKGQERLILPLVTWIYLLRTEREYKDAVGVSLRSIGLSDVLPFLPVMLAG